MNSNDSFTGAKSIWCCCGCDVFRLKWQCYHSWLREPAPNRATPCFPMQWLRVAAKNLWSSYLDTAPSARTSCAVDVQFPIQASISRCHAAQPSTHRQRHNFEPIRPIDYCDNLFPQIFVGHCCSTLHRLCRSESELKLRCCHPLRYLLWLWQWLYEIKDE